MVPRPIQQSKGTCAAGQRCGLFIVPVEPRQHQDRLSRLPVEAAHPPVDFLEVHREVLHLPFHVSHAALPGGRQGVAAGEERADPSHAGLHARHPLQRAQDLSADWPRWPDPTGIAGLWERHRVQQVAIRSTRQDERVDLSGHRGVLVFGPEIAPFSTLVAAVSAINIGRHTSYSLGRFDVTWEVR